MGDPHKSRVFLSFQEISEQFGLKKEEDFFCKGYPRSRSSIRATGIKPDEVENVVKLFFELPRSTRLTQSFTVWLQIHSVGGMKLSKL